MREMLYYIAWEWINIAIEFAASSWVRLPRWFLAVVGVNLLTHPLFTYLLEQVGRDAGFVLLCEAVIWGVECLVLLGLYRKFPWWKPVCAGIAMNAASYLMGLLINLP